MSAKSQSVDHAGVTWKFVPGSRRQQVLLRMIKQDDMLHHVLPERPADDTWTFIVPLWAGIAVGATVMATVWWLT